jgi:outer membrane protein insertion porin family
LDDFVRYRSALRLYTTPWQPVTLALMGRAGLLDPWRRPGTISEDQLFFLGGIGDMRGYAENTLITDAYEKPVGGRNAWSATVEARIDVGANCEVTAFVDGGQVGKPLTDPRGGTGVRSSIGLGLRYHTPIGPIGLLYGQKLDPLAGESSGRFHFAVGYTF